MKYLPWIVCALIAGAYPLAAHLPALVPLTPWGLAGIPLAPFKHESLMHLCANLLLLAYFLHIMRRDPLSYVLGGIAFIVLLGGTGVWLTGRLGIHEGASGVVVGLLAMLSLRQGFGAAVTVTSFVATALLFEVNQGTVSWETHLAGYLAGLAYAYLALRWYRTEGMSHDSKPSCAPSSSCTAECRCHTGPDHHGAGRPAQTRR